MKPPALLLLLAVACRGPREARPEPPPLPGGDVAASAPQAGGPEEQEPQVQEEEPPARIDRAHAWVSGNVAAVARWLDAFFATETHEDEVNRTRLRLRLDGTLEEGGERDLRPKAELRLSLPGTEDRLHLVVAGNPDDDLALSSDPLDPSQDLLNDSSQRDGSLAAEYYLLDDLRTNAKIDLGLRLRGGEPVPRLGLRYRRSVGLGSWLLRLTERGGWETQDGFDARSRVDLDRAVEASLLFRSKSELSWFEDRAGVFLNQSFSLSHRLSERRAMAYVWSNDFVTDPSSRLERVRLQVRYRQTAWRPWAFVEVTPEVRFPREDDFEADYALLLRLDLHFGAAQP